MQEAIKFDGNNINLYKINLKEGTKGIGFTNIIFYDNQNKTLPVGMDLSTKMIVDTTKLHLKLLNKKNFKVMNFNNENDDFSDITIKDVSVFEYEMVDLKDIEENKNRCKNFASIFHIYWTFFYKCVNIIKLK